MADIPGFMLPHTAKAWTKTGNGRNGPIFADVPVSFRCRWEGTTQQVAGPTGDQVVSNIAVYARPRVLPFVPVGTRLEGPHGQTAYVLAVLPHEDGGMGGWEHVSIRC
jgi:hypothetical protein